VGATVVKGDLDDTLSLREAMNAVDGVFRRRRCTAPEHEARAAWAVADGPGLRALRTLSIRRRAARAQDGIPHFESKAPRRGAHSRRSVCARRSPPGVLQENSRRPGRSARDRRRLVLRLALPPERKLQRIAVRGHRHPRGTGFRRARRRRRPRVEIAGDELSMTELARAFASLLDGPVRSRSSRSTSSPPETPRTRTCSAVRKRALSGRTCHRCAAYNPTLTTFADWLAAGGWPPARG